MGPFTCIGTPVRADETRSAAVCRDAAGHERVVIAARGYVLIVNPESGECRQVAFPEGHVDYPFAAMSGRTGLFYTGAGRMLMALDPFAARFVWWTNGEEAPGEEILGFAFAEADDGIVYATTYPGSKLLKLNPSTWECRLAARLDDSQKYAMSLATDRDGWVYAGIGTQEAKLCAFHPADGAVVQLIADESPLIGSGHVFRGTDGEVYASMPAWPDQPAEQGQGQSGTRSYRLSGGMAVSIGEADAAPSEYRGDGYNKVHRDLAGGRRLLSWSLAEGEIAILEADGRTTVLPLEYAGAGTTLSPLAAGPDGRVYGTSNHPLHFYRYDPREDALVNFGGKAVERGGGGNICAYAAQGHYLVGAAYAGGHVHLLDTRKDICTEPGSERNPRLIYSDDRIHRPRSALAHPDGQHVLYAGFPGYGSVGGALGIVHIGTDTVTVYDHEQIVPFQSTLGLAVLSGGDVVGGTSIETPGGADPVGREAVLYRLDWRSRQVVRRWSPIPGAKEISLLACDENDRIYGLTSSSVLFVFDPEAEQVLARHDLSAWGSVVRQGLVTVSKANGLIVYGLLSRGLFRVKPATLEPELVAVPPKPATSGIAAIGQELFFGCGSELWKYHGMMEENET